MSQEDILNIIKKFGGEATIEQIKNYAKKNYSGTLYLYILNRLKKLEINDKIYYIKGKWKIKK